VRGQTSFNRDYAKGKALLSMEETPGEVTWSVGSQVESDAVAKAFGLEGKKDLLQRGDAGPLTAKSSGTGLGCATIFLIIVVIVILLVMLKACEDQGGYSSGYSTSSPRSSGGWSGGSGGSHK
jgi:hypothetical protein